MAVETDIFWSPESDFDIALEGVEKMLPLMEDSRRRIKSAMQGNIKPFDANVASDMLREANAVDALLLGFNYLEDTSKFSKRLNELI